MVLLLTGALVAPFSSSAQRKELPEEWSKTHMIMWGLGASVAPQWSFGITYGQVQILGWYVSAWTGTGYHYNGDYLLNYSGWVEGDYPNREDSYNGRISKSRFSITGGMLFRTIKPLWGYVGTGWSYRSVLFGTESGNWLKSQEYSASGIAVEAGLIYNYRRVVFSLGFSTIGFKYIDGRAGIGFTF